MIAKIITTTLLFLFSMSAQAKMLDGICSGNGSTVIYAQSSTADKCVTQLLENIFVKNEFQIGRKLEVQSVAYDWTAFSNYNPAVKGSVYSFTANHANQKDLTFVGFIVVGLASTKSASGETTYACNTLDNKVSQRSTIMQILRNDRLIYSRTGNYTCL